MPSIAPSIATPSIATPSEEDLHESSSDKHSISTVSWKSDHYIPPNLIRPCPEEKNRDTKLWVDSQINSQNSNKAPVEEKPPRPFTPPFPPPCQEENFLNNKSIPNAILDAIRVEGDYVYIGNDVLKLDCNGNIVPSELNELREKWHSERVHLTSMKRNLQHLAALEEEQLKEAFKEKKKRKLHLLLK